MISLPPGGSSGASRQTRISFFSTKIDNTGNMSLLPLFGEAQPVWMWWVCCMECIESWVGLHRSGDTCPLSLCALYSVLVHCTCALYSTDIPTCWNDLHLPNHAMWGWRPAGFSWSLPLSPPLFYSLYPIFCIPCVSACSNDPPVRYFVESPD